MNSFTKAAASYKMFKALPVIRPALLSRYFALDAPTKEQLEALVKANKVVIFIKGCPEKPRCGFSNAVIQILRMHGVEYDHHDILSNDDLRQNIKQYSEWPTIPQVFIEGKFVGGYDLMLKLHQTGELIDILNKIGIKSTLEKTASSEKK